MPSVDTRVPSEDNHRNPIRQPDVLRDRLMLGRTVGGTGLMSSSHDNRADASPGPSVRAADSSSDAAKLAAYLQILEQLSPDDRTACVGRVVEGRSYDLIADGHSAASPTEARDHVSDAIARVLEEVLGNSPAKSVRLADLLGGDAGDADPEEQRLIAELRQLAHDASAHPETWGKFAIVAEIDAGGFGTVYRARDPDLDQDIALKLYHQHRSRGAVKDELLSEARKLARVRHPNVVRVYGAEEHDGRVGVWMELIEGRTLEAEVKDGGAFDADTATDIGMAVCDALSQVHAAGLAHGDITARNVMRDGDGRVVLTDFGAARFRVPRTSESSRGLAGTPAYLAPERFDRPEPTVQSDLYSVGVLLFYLVTGEYPVRGRSANELRAAHGSSASMVTLQSLKPDLPDVFARVVERALARSPEHRCLTAAEMRQELIESKPAAEPPITMRRVVRVLTPIGAAVVTVWALGYIASRAFEVALNLEEAFEAGPGTWFQVGQEMVLPFVAYTALASVSVGVPLLGAWWVANRLGTPVDAMLKRWKDPESPRRAATALLLVCIGAWAAITWVFSDVYTAFDAVRNRIPFDVAALSTARGATQLAASGFLTLVVGLLVGLWVPGLETRVVDARTVRLLKWATVVVALTTLAMAGASRRIVWEDFEVVRFEGRDAFVVGATAAELFLVAPMDRDGAYGRVAQDDPRLERAGTVRKLFETP